MHKYAYMAWDRNSSYFCDNYRKTEFLAPPPYARVAETYKRRPRAQGEELHFSVWAERNFDLCDSLCWQIWFVTMSFNRLGDCWIVQVL